MTMQGIALEAPVGVRIGDFEITNIDVYAVYGGKRATEVPAGATFEIHADYKIENFNPGMGFAAYWTTCMTVWDVTHNRPSDPPPAYDSFGLHTGGGLKSAADAVNCRMPDEPTTYRVKFFATQLANAGAPPETEW